MKRKSAVLALAVVVLSVTAVQAVPTTYVYTGNPFTNVRGTYSTSDFVTAMVTLANPLPPNAPLTQVTPLAFTLSDGVQTFTNQIGTHFAFSFATDGDGMITHWSVGASVGTDMPSVIITRYKSTGGGLDGGSFPSIRSDPQYGSNLRMPGAWSLAAVPEAASTLSLLSLSLTALGVAARQFKRAAAA